MQLTLIAGRQSIALQQRTTLKKIGLMAQWTAIFLLIGCLHVSASIHSQRITINERNAPLTKVLKIIRQQSGYSVIYRDEWMQQAKPVTVVINKQTLEQALTLCLKDQPFTFKIENSFILLQPKVPEKPPAMPAISRAESIMILSGRVSDTLQNPVEGASVFIKGTQRGTTTNKDGNFSIDIGGHNSGELTISCIGYKAQNIQLNGQQNIRIMLLPSDSKLDDIQIQAYGVTSKRLSTGNISTVTAAEIERQPVTNVLTALNGRVPGMLITQTTGVPGATVKVQIGGRTSINTNISNDPLFIIDGVPFANNNDPIAFTSALSVGEGLGLSPFNSINPLDIESITVLKDADATAIYGSRGANGVVLITTKKGKAGKTKVDARFYTGFNKVPKTMKMMNTQQYIAMRKEAFANDGVTPTVTTAPDLLVYDTTRYTDWTKFLIGNPSHTTDATLSVSGGNNLTQFLLGAGYHRETNVFPETFPDKRISFHFNLSHQSQNGKFKISFSTSYGNEINKQVGSDLTLYAYTLPPNTPPLLDSLGNLNWQENGVSFSNPLQPMKRLYTAKINNYISSLNISYALAKGLYLKSSLGYNSIYSDQEYLVPVGTADPALGNPIGAASFTKSNYRSLIIEPQLEYVTQIGWGKLSALLGGSWQSNASEGMDIFITGYTSDDLLGSFSAGTVSSKSGTNTEYRYAAAFTRINYNIADKYLINFTARRDGSSRFGPGKRFANFGSLGAGWIFSNENWVKNSIGLLSFGKLRGSYGSSGNDKIGDYNYLDTWTSTTATYLGASGLYPTRLFNPDYRWEINRKLNIGLELGFIKDRILFTADWFKNRSSNQLVQYALPKQTGGTSVTANFPATVQNSGIELTLNTQNIKKQFVWNTMINLTIPKNKLVAFPAIESSSYRYMVIGKSVNIVQGYRVSGVNKETGIYEYIAMDGSITGTPVSADAVKGIVNSDPQFYGGINNQLSYKGLSVDIFLDFKKQVGQNPLGNIYKSWRYPGLAFNMPVDVEQRWTPDNPTATIGKYTASTASATSRAINYMRLLSADIFYSDASFIRFKNIALSYTLPAKWLERASLNSCRLFATAQNLFTITRFEGTDPETQSISRLPPLRTYAFGIQVTL